MLLGIIIGILFFLTLFVEGTFISVPLLIVSVVLATVLRRSNGLIVSVFLLGILLDVITLGQIGQTSMFLLAVVMLIHLYDRKFETRSLPFVFFMSLIAVTLYLLLSGSYVFIIQLFVAVFYGAVTFFILEKFHLVKAEER